MRSEGKRWQGLRIKKAVVVGSTTVYIFSGCKVVAEYDNGALPASPSREYIYGAGPEASGLLAKIDSSGTKYYHQDLSPFFVRIMIRLPAFGFSRTCRG